MTVEEALAARARTAGNPAPAPLPPVSHEPTPRAPAPASQEHALPAPDSAAAVETGLMNLEELARRRGNAARTALSHRPAEDGALADGTGADEARPEAAGAVGTGPARSDPFTGAMNILRDPQGEKNLANTGVDGPMTSGFRLELPPRPSAAAAAEAARSGAPGAGPDDVPAQDGALPGPAVIPREGDGALPVRADGAQGLDTLDYLTASARQSRIRVLAVTGSLVLGGIAFVTGLMMIINSR
ncbi:MAG: hypothetical protein ABWX68_14080 [Arthrobacter sp.]|uniref:hypothetical protein n=1 Tax=Arthrobacter sp. TaxID=1667 RepID=UPI003489D989